MAVRNPIRPATGAEILDLRHFTSEDLRPLLEQEVERWGKTLAWDYRSSSEMILRYVDAKILPGYAAVERGSVVGYSFFVYEGSKGVIGDLFVSPRRADARAVELRLIEHVIETLQQSPGVQRAEAQLLAHDTGELAEPFVANGFHRYRRLFLTLRLRGPTRRFHRRRLTGGHRFAAGQRLTTSQLRASSRLRIGRISIPRSTTSTAPALGRCAS